MIPENVSVTGNNKDFSVNVPHFIHSSPVRICSVGWG